MERTSLTHYWTAYEGWLAKWPMAFASSLRPQMVDLFLLLVGIELEGKVMASRQKLLHEKTLELLALTQAARNFAFAERDQLYALTMLSAEIKLEHMAEKIKPTRSSARKKREKD